MAMNNSLAEVHPELVSEWSEKNLPLTPDDITFGSNKKVWWRGACGHEWQTSVKARSNGENVEYVINCLGKNTTKVRNIKSYLFASLFNTGSTIGSYYRAEVNHDMPQYAG